MAYFLHHGLPIPQVEQFPDRQWFLIAGVCGFERRLQKEFKTREVKYYLPRTHRRNEAGVVITGGPLFPGNIFAALKTAQEVRWLKTLTSEYTVLKQKQSAFLAELRFIKLAERLNGAYRFRWEPRLPDIRDSIILHDKTGNGYMQMELIADSVKLWFSFFHGSKIISFFLTKEQFTSLQNEKSLPF